MTRKPRKFRVVVLGVVAAVCVCALSFATAPVEHEDVNPPTSLVEEPEKERLYVSDSQNSQSRLSQENFPTEHDVDVLIQLMDTDVLDQMFQNNETYTASEFLDAYISLDPNFQSVVDFYREGE